jgi:hypothetical protein
MSTGPNFNFQKTQMVHGLGSDFIGSWVRIGMPAKKKTLSLLGNKSLKEQCSFCEKVLLNICLLPLVGNYTVTQQMVNGHFYRLQPPPPANL